MLVQSGVSVRTLVLLLLSKIAATSGTPGQDLGNQLERRADCRTQAVSYGDSCTSLAQKCGISPYDFTQYNQNPDPCGNLVEGQQVCCSSGTLPNRKPIQNWDGTCLVYVVKKDDYCTRIAASYDLTVADLARFNDKTTWGWQGCGDKKLMEGQSICLSTGSPPLPPPDANAVCGPTKPGTQRPKDGTKLADLNQCPLNACCNKWGQCGTTPEFCTAETGETGNPGTAPAGRNGCISNCGVYFANIRQPERPINVGYYESWNFERPCLTAKVTDIDLTGITHLHWAFADIDPNNLWLSVNNTGGQFDAFKQLSGVKRIISLGGWGFSTLPATYDILRRGMTGENVAQFVDNIIFFLNVHGLDGIDIDWEYPGAPDRQGVETLPPTGQPSDGFNYWAFLLRLKQRMPAGKSVSIAAPSSYWYLKAFPIQAMSDTVDYIVYMTYDLHGQWDYNNKWAVEGCPMGNCLRSHVNLTETIYALSMVTKAGVPTNKLVVGISSYGRSFGMEQGCDGPMCTFKGPKSAATPGRCTAEPGYLANAEINELIDQGGFGWKSWYDSASDSDMFVYGAGQWVAYMSDKTRASRKDLWKAWQFAGTADWALSLLNFYDNDDEEDGSYPQLGLSVCDQNRNWKDLDEVTANRGGMDVTCVPSYTLSALLTMLDTALNNYTSVDNGYDATFKYYINYVNNLVPVVLNKGFMFNLTKPPDVEGGLPTAGSGFSYFECQNEKTSRQPCLGGSTQSRLATAQFDPMTLYLMDEAGMRDALRKKGMMDEWVKLGEYRYTGYFVSDRNKQPRTYVYKNYPVRNESMIVPNPKDLLVAALQTVPALRRDMEDTLRDLRYGNWRGLPNDVTQVYSVPVFTIMQAIEGMAQAKKLGEDQRVREEKEEEERKKNLILTIISAILVVIPFVGSAGAAATGIASLARIAAIAGEAGGAALALYDSVKNPEMAFANVLGSLLGLRGLRAPRDADGLAGVANTRRGMTDIAQLGAIFKGQDDKLKILSAVCRR